MSRDPMHKSSRISQFFSGQDASVLRSLIESLVAKEVAEVHGIALLNASGLGRPTRTCPTKPATTSGAACARLPAVTGTHWRRRKPRRRSERLASRSAGLRMRHWSGVPLETVLPVCLCVVRAGSLRLEMGGRVRF
jgi:hypothetical protein